MLPFIKDGLKKLDDEWAVVDTRVTLLVLKVPVVGIVSPSKMSVIEA